MILIGPILMFGGLLAVTLADRLPARRRYSDLDAELLAEAQAQDEQRLDDHERVDREKEYAGAPAWVLEQ